MAVLPILTWPDPRLSRPCPPAGPPTPEIGKLAEDMLETMYAAPQVGRPLRLFVMDTGWKEGARSPRVCLDPQILWASTEMATGPEGCLSIPAVTAQVTRPSEIRLGWTDLNGDPQEAHLSGFDAVCAQHELDHLDGIMTFDRVERDMRSSLEAAYAAAQRA